MGSQGADNSVKVAGETIILPGRASEISTSKRDFLKNRSLENRVPEKSEKPTVDAEKHSSLGTELQMLPIFQALSDENRLKIIRLLAIRERTTPELLELVDVVQSTMSHHLKILTEAGLINCRKQGKRSCYSIRPDTFSLAEAFFARQLSSEADVQKR